MSYIVANMWLLMIRVMGIVNVKEINIQKRGCTYKDGSILNEFLHQL